MSLYFGALNLDLNALPVSEARRDRPDFVIKSLFKRSEAFFPTRIETKRVSMAVLHIVKNYTSAPGVN